MKNGFINLWGGIVKSRNVDEFIGTEFSKLSWSLGNLSDFFLYLLI